MGVIWRGLRAIEQRLLPRGVRRVIDQHVIPGLIRRKRREDWEAAWSRQDFNPPWLERDIFTKIVSAVEDGWFPAGGSVLDIGCGRGDTSAWLAKQGFKVLGIDIAQAAVDRATNRHGTRLGLEFLVLDIITESLPPDRRFAILVDNGCFHGIPVVDHPAYVRNVVSACASPARMLLFHKAIRSSRHHVERRVRRAFEPAFTVERVDPVEVGGPESNAGLVRGLVFRMSRP